MVCVYALQSKCGAEVFGAFVFCRMQPGVRKTYTWKYVSSLPETYDAFDLLFNTHVLRVNADALLRHSALFATMYSSTCLDGRDIPRLPISSAFHDDILDTVLCLMHGQAPDDIDVDDIPDVLEVCAYFDASPELYAALDALPYAFDPSYGYVGALKAVYDIKEKLPGFNDALIRHATTVPYQHMACYALYDSLPRRLLKLIAFAKDACSERALKTRCSLATYARRVKECAKTMHLVDGFVDVEGEATCIENRKWELVGRYTGAPVPFVTAAVSRPSGGSEEPERYVWVNFGVTSICRSGSVATYTLRFGDGSYQKLECAMWDDEGGIQSHLAQLLLNDEHVFDDIVSVHITLHMDRLDCYWY